VPPETRYVRLQGDRIAYQVFGDGPPDLVVVPGSFGHLDIAWEDAGMTLFFHTLASFCRLIVFDRRGTGISDPLSPTPLPPWESYAQELAAVLDEVGTERPAILAEVDAGPPAIFFAATNPDRTSALILAHTTAKLVAASDYPIGLPAAAAEALTAGTRAADKGAEWLRVDVWTTNEHLQHHYLHQGFTYVRTVVLPHNPSGALFQRPALRAPTPRLQEASTRV
jgi:pimeloyl-ACP methyl ester carboxylesterase